MTVAWNWALRSRYRIRRPFAGALLRDAPPAFLTLVIWPTILHFFTWLPWFAGENTVYRHAVGAKTEDSWLPDVIQSGLLPVLGAGLPSTTSAGNRHPWESSRGRGR